MNPAIVQPCLAECTVEEEQMLTKETSMRARELLFDQSPSIHSRKDTIFI